MMAGMDDTLPLSRTTAVTMVSLTELLSTCVDATRLGCDVIRSVHAKRTSAPTTDDQQGSDGDGNFAVKYKEDDDPRSAVTEADVAAQDVIVSSLRRTWDDSGTTLRLRIVGEEDGDDEDDEAGDEKGTEESTPPQLLSLDLLDPTSSFSPPDGDATTTPSTIPDSVPFDSVTIFVDPVDGTREFVEGRLGNVQCLVGVAINGRAVAGAVGLPFPAATCGGGDAADGSFPPPVVVYGLVGRGVGHWKAAYGGENGVAIPGHMPSPGSSPTDDEIVISTGDSSSSFLVSERRCADCAVTTVNTHLLTKPSLKTRHLLAGGSGNKLLMVSMGLVDIALIHDKTCLWDTCAPEAVLVASGGTVTDAFGSPLVHSVGGDGGEGDPKPVADGHRNALGVIASRGGGKGDGVVGKVHEETCRLMRCDGVALRLLEPWGLMRSPSGDEGTNPHPLPPQAVDVARSLDGAPLDVRWIEDRVLASCDDSRKTCALWKLEGYDAPEEEAVRGLMSNGCRLHLNWKRIITDEKDAPPPPPQDVSSPSPSPPMPPKSAFYKRIVMGDLPHARLKLRTMPKKLERDVRSYGVESSFYDSEACRRLIEDAHVHVPRAYDADLRPSSTHPIEGKFALLLEDFNECEGWRQEWLLGERSALAALESFARMHAYFWDGSNFWTSKSGEADDARRELTEAVWPSGGYVQPSLQTDGQTEQVASGWEVHLPKFAQHEIFTSAPELEGVDLEGLGRRLEAVAAEMGREAHPFCDKSGRADGFRKWRTLTHGDPKQANIFVREAAAKRVMPPGMAICDEDDDDCDDGDGDGKKLDVGLIDFQWCGFGLAATDVAHNITAALLPECLSVDGSREYALLDHYYSHLCRALVEFGVADSISEVEEELFPRSVLQSQYETAVLDMCRIVFAYSWRRFRHEDVPSVESANRNSYNKSVPTVVWLVARCDALLRKRGVVVS